MSWLCLSPWQIRETARALGWVLLVLVIAGLALGGIVTGIALAAAPYVGKLAGLGLGAAAVTGALGVALLLTRKQGGQR